MAPYLSYAQNYEDLQLARVFGDQPTGFYIDVGAGHPLCRALARLPATGVDHDIGGRGPK